MRVGEKTMVTSPSDSQTGEFTGFSRRRAHAAGKRGKNTKLGQEYCRLFSVSF
jgi:hypothetical protein